MADITAEKPYTQIKNGSIVTAKGYFAAGIHTGMKRKRRDLGMIFSAVAADSAAVYTTSAVQAAPIKVTKESLSREGKLQAVIVNSGSANAFTGPEGDQDAYFMRSETAQAFHVPEHYVAVASTGVIGERLPMDTIVKGIHCLAGKRQQKNADAFGEAILTTDTVTKQVCMATTIGGKTIHIGGQAKGSGMIHPNMATMLAFITTDAAVSAAALNMALKQAVDQTFNCITVDGDPSTNDMVLVMANGQAQNEPLTPDHYDWSRFQQTLTAVCEELAKMIARDGEGATKLIEVVISGGKNDAEARRAARQIAGSSLVKTAMFGNDANWGRIVAALGASGVSFSQSELDIAIGSHTVVKNGLPLTFSENEVSQSIARDTVKLAVNLHQGEGRGIAWGCDLTYDYVRINASYRT